MIGCLAASLCCCPPAANNTKRQEDTRSQAYSSSESGLHMLPSANHTKRQEDTRSQGYAPPAANNTKRQQDTRSQGYPASSLFWALPVTVTPAQSFGFRTSKDVAYMLTDDALRSHNRQHGPLSPASIHTFSNPACSPSNMLQQQSADQPPQQQQQYIPMGTAIQENEPLTPNQGDMIALPDGYDHDDAFDCLMADDVAGYAPSMVDAKEYAAGFAEMEHHLAQEHMGGEYQEYKESGTDINFPCFDANIHGIPPQSINQVPREYWDAPELSKPLSLTLSDFTLRSRLNVARKVAILKDNEEPIWHGAYQTWYNPPSFGDYVHNFDLRPEYQTSWVSGDPDLVHTEHGVYKTWEDAAADRLSHPSGFSYWGYTETAHAPNLSRKIKDYAFDWVQHGSHLQAIMEPYVGGTVHTTEFKLWKELLFLRTIDWAQATEEASPMDFKEDMPMTAAVPRYQSLAARRFSTVLCFLKTWEVCVLRSCRANRY